MASTFSGLVNTSLKTRLGVSYKGSRHKQKRVQRPFPCEVAVAQSDLPQLGSRFSLSLIEDNL
jgi:hypothetical protein